MRATDVDSEDSEIIYTIKKNPTDGNLLFTTDKGSQVILSVEGPYSTFLQRDIDKGIWYFFMKCYKLNEIMLNVMYIFDIVTEVFI